MIKLNLPSAPAFLTPELVSQLTNEFMADRKRNVWNRSDLKEALLSFTYGKCAYSEAKLNQEGKFMQVEHFYPKSKYPKRVMEWGNLLPSINICNMRKRDCDPMVRPMVNPLLDDPKEYFYILNGRLYPHAYGNKKAVNTIEVCDLNNERHFRKIRFELERGLEERLEDIHSLYGQDCKKAMARLRSIMNDSGRTAAYSATKSTFIISNRSYLELRSLMMESGFWSDEFINLEKELHFCSLPQNNDVRWRGKC